MYLKQSSQVACFGPFRLDLKAGEVHKDGRRIRLHEQPFRVLTLLLEHPGEVVTREEIRRRLWPNDTVVEFDNGINAAIKKVREALGDSAGEPRYIETLARRGYRFVMPVEWEPSSDGSGVAVEARAGAQDSGEPASPPAEAAPARLSPINLSASRIGQRVSHYRVLDVVGGGGMGLVYRAEDIKLGRKVALKFLPEEMAADPVALERFEREARAASALNHPNICTIHEIEEHAGQPFIVMELLEGQTLRDLLEKTKRESRGSKSENRKAKIENQNVKTPTPSFEFRLSSFEFREGAPLPLGTILDLAVQIAAGLEAAHQQGIIHRDIKPANIFVTRQGQAKILDFGLAKLQGLGVRGWGLGTGDEGLEADEVGRGRDPKIEAQSLNPNPEPLIPDLTLTRTGIAIGTAGYMSPEQIRGERLDARTDLFSFGLVLYEMATGARAFSGETAAVLREQILRQAPPRARELRPELPAKLEEIICRALEKDREARYPSAAGMGADLRSVLGTLPRKDASRELAATQKGESARRRPLIAAMVVAVTVVGLWLATRPQALARVTHVRQLTHFGAVKDVVMTDGKNLYFDHMRDGHRRVFQVSVEGGEPAEIPLPFLDVAPLDVSPDFSKLLVGAWDAPGALKKLWTLPLGGGPPQRLGKMECDGAFWSPRGSKLVCNRQGTIWVSDADGSNEKKLPNQAAWGSWSPDERLVRFGRMNQATGGGSTWEANTDGTHVHPFLPERQIPNARWGEGQGPGHWTPDGRYYLFTESLDHRTTVLALKEATGFLQFRGPQPVEIYAASFGIPLAVMSPDGKRLFALSHSERREMLQYDRASRQFVPFLPGVSADFESWSPDGQQMAYVTVPEDALWIAKADGNERRQLTFSPLWAYNTVWSSDGKQLASHILLPGKPGKIALIPAGGGKPQVLFENEPTGEDVPSFSPDGQTLLFARTWLDKDGNTTDSSPCLLNLKTGAVSRLPGGGDLNSGAWSPDGRYIAAQSKGFHRLMLFDVRTGKWTALATGGFINSPYWSRDSKLVYYQELAARPDQPVYRVRISDGRRDEVKLWQQLQRGDLVHYRLQGFTPGGDLVAQILRQERDVYALDLDLP